jgi:hypothetical protein
MWVCPKCDRRVDGETTICPGCLRTAASYGPRCPPELEEVPTPAPEASNDDFPDDHEGWVKDIPIPDQTEGCYSSQWGARGARLGFQGGCVGSLLIAGSMLVGLVVRLSSPHPLGFDELLADLGAGLFVIVFSSLTLIFFLTVTLGSGGIVLEAVVKSIRGRPKGVDRALALFKENARKRSRRSRRSKRRRQQQTAADTDTGFAQRRKPETPPPGDGNG